METLYILAPFPLYDDYGSSVRVISELKILENGITKGYIDNNIHIKIFAYDISQTYLKYLWNIRHKLTYILLPKRISKNYQMGANISRLYMDLWLIKNFIKTYASCKSLVYMHTSIPLFYLNLLKKFKEITSNNIIVDLHGIALKEVGKFMRRVLYPFEKTCILKVNKIVFSNISTRICFDRIFLTKNVYKENMHIFPDVIDTDIFKPMNDMYVMKLKKKLKLDNKVVILYVGSFTKVQGIDKLIESFPLIIRDIPNAYLLLVGGKWTPIMYKKYARMIKKYREKIKIWSSVSYLKGLKIIINLADITVSPKFHTCQSNQKVLVYAAIGKPIVVYNTLANRFLLKNNAFYAYKFTSEALAKAILQAYDKISTCNFNKENLRKYVKKKFSLNSTHLIKEYVNILLNYS